MSEARSLQEIMPGVLLAIKDRCKKRRRKSGLPLLGEKTIDRENSACFGLKNNSIK